MQRLFFSYASMSILILIGFFLSPCAAQQPDSSLIINELMAINGSGSDWLELYNGGRSTVDLAGYYLTDDSTEPRLWQFPLDRPQETRIPAGGYLVVWADDAADGHGLHASFKLGGNGESLHLYQPDGVTLVDELFFPQQHLDISYGRHPLEPETWQFLPLVTPGAANLPGFLGVVADTKFSLDRGFYQDPIQVTITTETPDAQIVYTLDGSEPLLEGNRLGRTAQTYTQPIPISRTTCLRAAALKTAWLSTNIDTQTYFFLEDIKNLRQSQAVTNRYPPTWFGGLPADYEMDPDVVNHPDYRDKIDVALLSLPTVSLVTNPDYLFSHSRDPETGGIYIYTGHGSTGGAGWERPASVEFLGLTEDKTYQANCGIRIQGGENRKPDKCPKHGFSLRFRDDYGPTRLDLPILDSEVESFDTLQLRGFFNNSWIHWSAEQGRRCQYIRDQWMRDSMIAMGHADAGQGRFVHLYLNGMYWGLYNLQERPVASHYAAYNGGDEERIDAINGGTPTDGTSSAWQALRQTVEQGPWEEIENVLDVDNFIDYTLINLFGGNQDLKNNGNWRAAGGGEDQRPWRFYPWDSERVLESVTQQGTRPTTDPTRLLTPLMRYPAFIARMGDRIQRHCFGEGALTPAVTIERWSRRAEEIDLAVIAESARWGDYRRDVHQRYSPGYLFTRNGYWLPEQQRLLNQYFPQRTENFVDNMRSAGNYPSLTAPQFTVNSAVSSGTTISSADRIAFVEEETAIWYTLDGTDPRIGYGGDDDSQGVTLVAEAAEKRVLIPSAAVNSAWRGGASFIDDDWRAGTGGVGYERSSGYDPFFNIDVESQMYNRRTSCLIRIPFTVTQEVLTSLSRLLLLVRYDDGFVAYLNGQEVRRANLPGSPTWQSGANSTHDDGDAVQLQSFDISGYRSQLRAGDNILAIHGLNASTSSSDFLISVALQGRIATDTKPVQISPSAVEYTGFFTLPHSVTLKARAYDGIEWSAQSEATFAVGPITQSLRISEIMYHPQESDDPIDPNTEFIELVNTGSEAINLNLVSFSDGVEMSFPDVEVAPGAVILAVRDTEAFTNRYGPGLPIAGQYAGKLSNGGEWLELKDALGQVFLRFRYDDNWYESTDGDGYSLTLVNRQADPGTMSEMDAWQPSQRIGGSPGVLP